ncbi:MAG TPA: 3-deoxy-8-phosphooctulonate synthase [Syntrophales bacterium]|nr:3-deoxy-8-phosphooctulonate synthase [Syntrophales bacterium]HRS86847.1 3-deoxy-8-phosphooctulonate synthase [Syntrophales bacterium]HRV42345.1 3-deoxy-8-phosphooctulonate synthase [Syntrophales bacterium]
MRQIRIKDIVIGGGAPFVLIAGPCVIEDETKTRETALFLKEITARLPVPFIFKASYDKANRTSLKGFRGPGIEEGLAVLESIRRDFDIPVLSDVHRFEEIERAAEVLDVVQIPAFLCRQTDFVMEVARASRVVNVKKGQFLSPWEVANIVEKVRAAGNENLLITERGTTFGYNNLVADFRSLPILRRMGYPVVFDATHSVQLPGASGTASGGQRSMVPYLARAAAAVGVDGIFMEVHPCPDEALCDGPNSVSLDSLEDLLLTLAEIDGLVKKKESKE